MVEILAEHFHIKHQGSNLCSLDVHRAPSPQTEKGEECEKGMAKTNQAFKPPKPPILPSSNRIFDTEFVSRVNGRFRQQM